VLFLAPLLVALPLLVLADVCLRLGEHGPGGWAAAAGLVAGTAWVTPRGVRRGWRWWAATKAPVRPASGGGRGRAAAAPRDRPGGTSRG
jgi:hypothetical protein